MGSTGDREGREAVVGPRHGARRSPNGPLTLDLGCPFDGKTAQVFPFWLWGIQVGRLLLYNLEEVVELDMELQ